MNNVRPFQEFYLGDKVARGGHLNNLLIGKPLIIFGNSNSLQFMALEKMTCFHTLGCNRILQLFEPDFYTVADRQPYMQELARIRAYKGIRLLSATLFDPAVSCRRMPVQPIPNFEWYRWRAVASGIPVTRPGGREFVMTTFTNDQRVHNGMLPACNTDLDAYLPSGANIGYCMLQQAIALGANPIGIAGIDLPPIKDWTATKNTHFFGDGRKVGAFPFNSERVLRFFKSAAGYCQVRGIQVYNLAPAGHLNCFPRMNEHEFHHRFSELAPRDMLRPRQLRVFVPDQDRRIVGFAPDRGRQPHPPDRARTGISPHDRGLVGSASRVRSREQLRDRIADVQRARLARNTSRRKA